MDKDGNEKITKKKLLHSTLETTGEDEGFQSEVPLTTMWCTMHFIELILETDDEVEGFQSEVPLTLCDEKCIMFIPISDRWMLLFNQKCSWHCGRKCF